MSIAFPCQDCGQLFEVDNEHAGKKAKCSHCGAQVIVPEETLERVAKKLAPPEPPPKVELPTTPPAPQPLATNELILEELRTLNKKLIPQRKTEGGLGLLLGIGLMLLCGSIGSTVREMDIAPKVIGIVLGSMLVAGPLASMLSRK